MGLDYSEYGLDKNLQKVDAPFTTSTFSNSFDVSSQYDQLQTKTLIASSVALKNFVKRGGAGAAGFNFASGSIVNVTVSSIYNAPQVNTKMFSNFYPAVYQGTSANSVWQIYPRIGGSVEAGGDTLRYKIQESLDYHAWTTGGGSATAYAADRLHITIVDTSGTNSDNHYVVVDSNYIDYVLGNSTTGT